MSSQLGFYPKFHGTDPSTGMPLVGGLLYTYAAGTSTPLATYADSGLTTPNANPIVLDASGEALLYCGALSYKLVLCNSLGAQLWSVDNYAPNIASIGADAQWVAYGATATQTSATTFSVSGDQTAVFGVGRRLRSSNTGGTVYSTVQSSSYAAGTTSVVVTNDTGSLDGGFSSLAYGLVSYQDPSYLDPRSAVQAVLSAAQTGIGTGQTAVVCDSKSLDVLTEYASGHFAPRYTGIYLIAVDLNVTSSSTGTCTLIINVNGAIATSVVNASSGVLTPVSASAVANMLGGFDQANVYVTFSAGAANQVSHATL